MDNEEMFSSTTSLKGSGSEKDSDPADLDAELEEAAATRRSTPPDAAAAAATSTVCPTALPPEMIASGSSAASTAVLTEETTSSSPIFPAEFEPNLFVDDSGELFYHDLSLASMATAGSGSGPRDHSSPHHQRRGVFQPQPPFQFGAEAAAASSTEVNGGAASSDEEAPVGDAEVDVDPSPASAPALEDVVENGEPILPVLPPSLPDYFLRGDGHIEDYVFYRSMQRQISQAQLVQQQQQNQQQQPTDQPLPNDLSSFHVTTSNQSQVATSLSDSDTQPQPRQSSDQTLSQLLPAHGLEPDPNASTTRDSGGGEGNAIPFAPSSACPTIHSPPPLDLPLHDEPQLLSDIEELTENGSDLDSPASRGSGTSGTSNGSSSGMLFHPAATGHGSYAGFHG